LTHLTLCHTALSAAESFRCLPLGTASNLSRWRNHAAIQLLSSAYSICSGNKSQSNNIPQPVNSHSRRCSRHAGIDCAHHV